MPTTGGTKSADSPYQLQLFPNFPLYGPGRTKLLPAAK